MKIAMIVIRTLMGLMFLFSSITYLFKLFTPPPMTGNLKLFMDGVNAVVYLLPLIKVTELVCSIALLLGRFVPLAAVILFPIIINIVLVNYYLTPAALSVAIPLLLCDLFLAYYYRNNYKTLLAAK